MLFSIFLQTLFEEAFRGMGGGVYVQSRQNADLFKFIHFRAQTKTTQILVREMLFADDKRLCFNVPLYALVASKKAEVLYQLNSTKSGELDIMVNGNKLNTVPEFSHLGSIISSDGSTDAEIHSASSSGLRQKLWNNHDVSLLMTV